MSRKHGSAPSSPLALKILNGGATHLILMSSVRAGSVVRTAIRSRFTRGPRWLESAGVSPKCPYPSTASGTPVRERAVQDTRPGCTRLPKNHNPTQHPCRYQKSLFHCERLCLIGSCAGLYCKPLTRRVVCTGRYSVVGLQFSPASAPC